MTVKKRAANRRWKAKNPDKVRASARKANKKYRAANLEKVRAWKREQIKRYRAKYPEKVKAQLRKYRAEHPEYVRELNRKQSRRLRTQRRDMLTALLGGKCITCDATRGLEFDHVNPSTKAFKISAGLLRSLDELLAEIKKCVLRCNPCHDVKTQEERLVRKLAA
jgi:hypothetical protein